MRIALVMLDQKYGGIQQDFLNYSIELSKRGLPVLCVIRNESFVEKKLRKAGISSIAIINNRFGFHDPFAIRQIGKALDEFFIVPRPYRTVFRVPRHFVLRVNLNHRYDAGHS